MTLLLLGKIRVCWRFAYTSQLSQINPRSCWVDGQILFTLPTAQLDFGANFSVLSKEHPTSSFLQRSAPGLVNFIPGAAYHFCPSLSFPAAFTQPGASTLADLCTQNVKLFIHLLKPIPNFRPWRQDLDSNQDESWRKSYHACILRSRPACSPVGWEKTAWSGASPSAVVSTRGTGWTASNATGGKPDWQTFTC